MTNSIGTLWIFGESPIDLRKSFFKNYSMSRNSGNTLDPFYKITSFITGLNLFSMPGTSERKNQLHAPRASRGTHVQISVSSNSSGDEY